MPSNSASMSASDVTLAPHFPTSPSRERVVRIASHQRRQVECDAQAGRASGEQIAIPAVCVFRRAESGKLPHRPELALVTRRHGCPGCTDNTRDRRARARNRNSCTRVRGVEALDGRPERLDRCLGGGQAKRQRPAAPECDGPLKTCYLQITKGLAIFSAPPGRGLFERALPILIAPEREQNLIRQWLDGLFNALIGNGAVILLYTFVRNKEKGASMSSFLHQRQCVMACSSTSTPSA